MTEAARKPDWAASTRTFLVFWGLPIALLIVSGAVANEAVMIIAWPLSLGWMGGACFLNALRCGRFHCLITGPFFLALGVLSLLHGLGILPLGAQGWHWLGSLTAVGGVSLTSGPEWIWGRYVGSNKDAYR